MSANSQAETGICSTQRFRSQVPGIDRRPHASIAPGSRWAVTVQVLAMARWANVSGDEKCAAFAAQSKVSAAEHCASVCSRTPCPNYCSGAHGHLGHPSGRGLGAHDAEHGGRPCGSIATTVFSSLISVAPTNAYLGYTVHAIKCGLV